MSTTSHHQQWNSPTGALRFSGHEVHVWQASLNASSLLIQRLQQILTEEEVVRASRFAFEKERQHFIVARGVLRAILSRYLRVDPGYLRFDANAFGKPLMELSRDESRLNFNLAHSHEQALYVFMYAREVRIDVENMHIDFDFEGLVKYSFSLYEQSILHVLPGAAKQQAFLYCWTRKEAHIKARGKGLSTPLDLFDVSLGPGEHQRGQKQSRIST